MVEELQEQIAGLVSERQDLRTFGASRASLEQNRLQLVRSSCVANGTCHRRSSSGTRGSAHQPDRLVGVPAAARV